MSLPSPELSPDWWKDVRPANVRGRDLEKALREFEKADEACAKNAKPTSAVAKALKSLTRAVTRATRECDEDEDEDVIDALGDLVELAEERLEELESKGDHPLLDIRRLRDQMRLLGKMPMTFALGLKGGDSVHFTLDRYQSGVPLMSKLKQAADCNLATYGRATAEGNVLVLDVRGRSLSGLRKRVKEFLQENQPLPFQKVRLGAPESEEPASQPKEEKDAVAVARKIAKALNAQRKKLEKTLKPTVERLQALEKDASDPAAATALRRALQEHRDEGRARVKRVKETAEKLLQEKSPKARKALEKAARDAAKGFEEAARKADEAAAWLDSSAGN